MITCIDIGGSKTRVAVSEDGKTFLDIKTFPTFEDFSDQMNEIIKYLKPYKESLQKVSIAAAGIVDRSNGNLVWWGQRKSWWGKSFFVPIKKEFPNAKIAIENDADMAGLGEATFGAGRNHSVVGYITLSSGIGGGLVIDGKIPKYKLGFEVGHHIINFNETEVWSCGQRGCFESYASGFAFQKMFGIAGEDCEDTKIWEKYAGFLAVGLANIMAIWSPQIIVLGGGVSNRFDIFYEPLVIEIKKRIPYELPEIVRAELDEPGLYGGLALF